MHSHFFVLILSLIFFCACQQKETNPLTQEDNAIEKMEQHRPHYHFTPPQKWMNDPNGMVFYDGEYHLFYQHYPDSTVWGPMHWGHAVSKDLVNWEHLPIALYPDDLGLIFSGSAVIDWNNTSGLGKDGQPPMIAIYTYHHMEKEKAGDIDFQYQGMAYSNDKGRTWTKYEQNPIIPNPGIRDFRDPKVIWDENSNQWVMVFSAWDHSKFYGSPDLINWTHLSDFGKEWGTHSGVWECPDLFPMQVEGTNEKKWVLIQSLNPGSFNGGSGTQYFVGDFDGKNFILDEDFAKALGTDPAYVPESEIFEDFENDYGDWKTEGEAFGTKPANGAFENQQALEGQVGAGLVNSFLNGDKSTGKLISPEFEIKKDFINFKVGGGNDKLRTRISLVVNGETVRSASGGNGEKLRWTGWDVSEYRGTTAHIEIVDNHTGGWGHINVDQISFADKLAIPEREKAVWLDYGRDNYAGVTWSDVPKEDGRRIFMGWMSNWDYAQVVPTDIWRSAMTLPRELVLKETSEGLRLYSKAVEELEKLRINPKKAIKINEQVDFNGKAEMILEFSFAEGESTDFGVELTNSKGESYQIGFDASKNEFYSDRRNAGKKDFSTVFAKAVHTAPRLSKDTTIKMHMFIDVASAELFADEGATVMTDIFFPNEDFSSIKLYAKNGSVTLVNGHFYEL